MTSGARLKPEPRQVVIGMPYPGQVISVNHYRGRTQDGREYVKADAEAWMNMLGWLIKAYHIEDWRLPLRVTCSGTFRDERAAPDLSNLSKCILDAIEDTTGVNDREMRWKDGDREIDGTKEPELIITIGEAIADGS
jgi:Holliday junction resolvase RusA-like endonuclease